MRKILKMEMKTLQIIEDILNQKKLPTHIMSLDKRVLETIKNKIAEENEDSKISEVLITWLNNIDEGKKDIDTNKIIQELINKIKD